MASVDALLRAQGLDPSRWSNGPGDRYAAHEHGYDKVIVVERGSIRFGLSDAAVVDAHDGRSGPASVGLAEGDRLELPAATRHDAVVGPVGVVCLEAHLPAGSFERVARRTAGTW